MAQELSVVEVVHSLGLGGSEILGKDLAVALSREFGYRCAICAVDKGGILSDELAAVGIPTFVAKGAGTGVAGGMLNLARFLMKFRPAVVHTHHLNQLFYAVLGARLSGARIIHTEHEFYSLQGPKQNRIFRVLSRFCHRITTVGDEVTSYLHREMVIPESKLVTIPNGIDLSYYHRDYSLPREALGIGRDEIVIGIVARLEPVKGHDVLLRAFRQVMAHHPACRLLIVGGGSLRDSLEDEARRAGITAQVTFTGPRRDIPALLSLMDIFVLSSHEEGLPISLLEGMAAALPVIATSVGSIPEVVGEGKNGFLTPPGSVDGLAAALNRLVADPVQRRGFGAAGREIIENRFNFRHSLEAYHRIFQG